MRAATPRGHHKDIKFEDLLTMNDNDHHVAPDSVAKARRATLRKPWRTQDSHRIELKELLEVWQVLLLVQ